MTDDVLSGCRIQTNLPTVSIEVLEINCLPNFAIKVISLKRVKSQNSFIEGKARGKHGITHNTPHHIYNTSSY